MYLDNRVIGVLLVCHHMIYVSLSCMPVYVYALILLLYDKFHVTLAYPCILCCFCYVSSFAMITFWWEQMRGRFELDLRNGVVRPRFPVWMS